MDKKYKKICLGKDDNGKRIIVDEHRYIMEQHLGRKLKKDEVVHHIDGDKTNNKIYNLEVMKLSKHSKFHFENGDYSISPQNKSRLSKESKIKLSNSLKKYYEKNNKRLIQQFDFEGNLLNTFYSTREAARFLSKTNNDTKNTHISEVCRGKRKSAYGYVWKYKI